MNRYDELFDIRIADWLEGDPELAPAQVLETVRAALPSVPQRRVARAPWRVPMVLRVGFATAAIVIGVAIGAGLVGQPSGNVGGSPSPSPSPSATISATATPRAGIPTSGLVTFTSEVHGYTIGYPGEWDVRPATRKLDGTETPWDYSPAIDHFSTPTDRFGDPAGGPLGALIVGSAVVGPEVTLESWTVDTAVLVCGPPTAPEAVEVDGEPASLLTYSICNHAFHQWVTVLHGGSAYHIIWLGESGARAFDRALFEDILATFSFPPEPSATPTPS